ncbi:hypothetical protein A3H85_00255 [Candidatus Daviesbacteria bacterium RIFCSPLOWO2_02_FULL_40_8]|uniref:DUF378 domain-containing protein n=1 Tax=Candidatus Daviesbacteria bacterium RIFCSPLOWO2_01_FULL_40_24 TaxID=1797787 RepID=A0A1F5MK68_9BACT|nr:MAG: hypothetical protein A2780_00875 [Candidatus Daviesbacteria bacterium RIFCSPHIGHO2_01_FULL_41_45]OGE34851.1 MAG: hypothetical protein A3C32_01620 [Candidatus Daviesbacteria bacterium RIFCSPHIGHO2_02_FULL_41_14]OGE65709.1 MAG: hypothetical protein A3B49_04045 [Candidatus Daviesbacteria bacterium RIFCSPLOWO2_01_FULL_40_24]OGE66829.1 MAG: hypothetical protein A3H85_00255 [Candidatus Daviesbacteria bacterium RIFCSPLOWO2_02_FULL_40_8]
MRALREYSQIAVFLVVVGALNWGLVGLTGYNLINFILGTNPKVESVAYILIGLSGVWLVWSHWLDGVKNK